MAYFETRENRLDRMHRPVEAMYRRGCSFEEIAASCHLSMMDVYDITQKIFALDEMKKEKARRARQ